MPKLILTLVLLQTIINPSWAKKSPDSISLNKVTVVGSVPGPDLWKISKDNHVLWILGTISPLPKRLNWNSKPIEKVIKNSQALVLPATVTADIGFFKALSLASSAIGIKKNPEKEKLKDILNKENYTRWLTLKNKYMPKNKSIEKTRPIYASNQLFEKAIKKSGLRQDTKVLKKVKRYAKKHKLELITPKITIDLNNPKAALKKLKKTKINDHECFEKTLERLETDLDAMKARAVAWSYGDIKTIKSLPYPDENQACSSAFLNSQFAQEIGLENIRSQLRSIWLEETKKAISLYKSSFAVLPISQLLSQNSFLNDLKSAGYQIDPPKEYEED